MNIRFIQQRLLSRNDLRLRNVCRLRIL